MKRTILLTMFLWGICASLQAQEIDGVSVRNVTMGRNGAYMAVDMDVDLSALEVDGNRAVLLTPRIANGADTLSLASIGIYGRRRYLYYIRNGAGMLSGEGEMTYRASLKPDDLAYRTIVPYAEWMNGASLLLDRKDYGCCHTLLAEQHGRLGGYAEPAVYVPEIVFVRPAAEAVKSRSLSGSAFIDFPVNKTVIYPEYRRNTVELGKIDATIDSVRLDADVTITGVWLKGYASPESPYSHNRDLAIGRTEALKNHIQQLYRFAEGVISTDYEPEDWAGLRRYVEVSNLTHREEILALIASDMEPDAKEAKIRRTYPEEYRFLLQNCYPALRHTDYRIDYTIRSFSDVEEIRRLIRTQPQKLSLNEFFLAARSCDPGSEEFASIFETAAHMYPDDPTANLNAANAALGRGDLKRAEGYLSKSGSSPEAVYARGVLAVLNGDRESARRLFDQAARAGIAEAERALRQLDATMR